jgi:hypothetical protein
MATSWRQTTTSFPALPPARLPRAAFLAWLVQLAWAAPIGSVHRLDSVVHEADAIAVGVVGATRSTNSGSVVILEVLDTLKGSLPGSVEASYDAGPGGSLTLFENDSTGKTVMVFLSAPADGGIRPLCPLTGGALPRQYALLLSNESAAVDLPARKPDDSALVKVIKELARTAAVSPVSGAWGLHSLASARDTEPDVPNVLRDVFQALSSASDRRIANRAVSGLLALGQVEGLLALENVLLLRPGDIAENPDWADALGSYYRSESRQGTAVLERLIAPEIPAPWRKAAALALAKVNAPHMVPLLARLLEDSDVDLRATAVLGLSMFCAGFRVSGPQRREGEWPFLEVGPMTWAVYDNSAFRRREQEYLTFWRGWWDVNQQRVRTLAASEEAGR